MTKAPPAKAPAAAPSGTPQPVGPTGGHYALTFDDEFSAGSLAADPHWSATSPFSPNGSNSWSSARSTLDQNGYLTQHFGGGVSGIVSTKPGLAAQPVEVRPGSVVQTRVWLPSAPDGSIADWPAFWLDGQNWPADGEIDIMEGLHGQACYHIHDSAGGPGGCAAGTFTDRWNTFTADWSTSGTITFYYNGVRVGAEHLNTSAPEYLVLELNTGEGGTSVESSQAAWDYVRVWSGG